MRPNYDFANMEGRKNPYASKLKTRIAVGIDMDMIDYFKSMAEESGIPYQSLINLYLRDGMKENRKVNIRWDKRRYGEAATRCTRRGQN